MARPLRVQAPLVVLSLTLAACTIQVPRAAWHPGPEADDQPIEKIDLWRGDVPLLRGANMILGHDSDEADRTLYDGTLHSHYTQEDFDRLAAEGANLVVFSMPGLFLPHEPYDLLEPLQDVLDVMVSRAEQADLFVVIAARSGPGRSQHSLFDAEDLPEGELVETFWSDPGAQAAWGDMWRHTAARYGGSSAVIGYHIMVEPNAAGVADAAYPGVDYWDSERFFADYHGTSWDWNVVYPSIVDAIREVDPHTPVLVGSDAHSSLWWLETLEPIDDPATVYVVHQYEPFGYTHQAAYAPVSAGDVGSALDTLMERVDVFRAQHDVPMAVTEYGVHRFAPGAAEVLALQHGHFEARGLSSAVWAMTPSVGYFGSEDFDLFLGPDPASTAEVPNAVLDEMRAHWSANIVRPSTQPSVALPRVGAAPTFEEPSAQGPAWLDDTAVSAVPDDHELAHVRTWTCVLREPWEGDKIERLAASPHDLVVLEDPRTLVDMQGYDAGADVAAIQATEGAAGEPKIVLAHVDVAHAQDSRYYWQAGWGVGEPEWIVAADADGAPGSFPVAYWDDAWYALLFGGVDSVLQRVIADGYDGIYMDGIAAVSSEHVVAAAEAHGLDPAQEMFWLVEELVERAYELDPDFLVVAQNGLEMREQPGWLDLLHAQAQEQVWFDGVAGVFGDDPRQGDCALPSSVGDPEPGDNAPWCAELDTMQTSSQALVEGLRGFLEAGVPVLTLDYALEPENAAVAYEAAEHEGFVGYVTMRSLEDLSATPPPTDAGAW